ncbi:MAG: 3'(2'),5'-bisphosphate nucleotidase CysQ [Cyclobacteriaceae bacterium]
MDLKNLLELAIKAAKEASVEILNVYNSNDFDVESKGDHSPLTRADKVSHKCIVKILEQTNIPILSEEGKDIPFNERKNWNHLWIVDPLDGTKEFIKRNGEFTVNIALVENGKPILGVVAVPVEGKVFYGAEGQAFVDENNKATQLYFHSSSTIAKGIRVVASRSHLNEETSQFIESLKEPVLVSRGSSLKFMLLAEGKADVYPRFAPTMEWDTAAPHAILNQIGIKVYQKDSKEELSYNKRKLTESFIHLSMTCDTNSCWYRLAIP